MSKDEAIRKFREGCKDPVNRDSRKVAVETQFNRDKWAIYSSIGKVAIWKSKDIPRWNIEVFGYSIGYFGCPISEQIYNELKDLYFGEFKPNEKYLQTLNSILS